MMQQTGYSIQTMAALCGMTAHALRYYERVGLIQPVWRGPNGHRRYSDQDQKWLKVLKLMRLIHMPIRELHAMQPCAKAGRAVQMNKVKFLKVIVRP